VAMRRVHGAKLRLGVEVKRSGELFGEARQGRDLSQAKIYSIMSGMRQIGMSD
jgi:hypothetical protein